MNRPRFETSDTSGGYHNSSMASAAKVLRMFNTSTMIPHKLSTYVNAGRTGAVCPCTQRPASLASAHFRSLAGDAIDSALQLMEISCLTAMLSWLGAHVRRTWEALARLLVDSVCTAENAIQCWLVLRVPSLPSAAPKMMEGSCR